MTKPMADGRITWSYALDNTGFKVIAIDDCPVGADGVHDLAVFLIEGRVFSGGCKKCERPLDRLPGNIPAEIAKRMPPDPQGDQ